MVIGESTKGREGDHFLPRQWFVVKGFVISFNPKKGSGTARYVGNRYYVLGNANNVMELTEYVLTYVHTRGDCAK